MGKEKKVGKARETVAKASKGLGKASTSLFTKKGNKSYAPKIKVIG